MKIYWKDVDSNNNDKIEALTQFTATKKEKKLGYLLVLKKDLDNLNVGYCLEMFIKYDLNKNHKYYNFLKDLIYSKNIDNYIIAWNIINKLK